MSLTLVLVIFCVTILLEGLFSGSEIALVSAHKLSLERGAKNGHLGSVLALKLLENSSTMLSVTLIGTNIAVVTNTVVVTFYFLQEFGPRGELYALLTLTPAILLFGEIIPKSLFQQHADSLAPKIAFVIYYARIPFFPLVLLMKIFTKGAGQLLGFHRNKAMAISREDLKFLIEEEEEKEKETEEEIPEINMNSIKEGEREMVGNILDLRDTTAEEVMIPLSEVVSAPDDSSLEDLVAIIDQHGFSRIPIYHERVDAIVGIVHGFDLLTALGSNLPVARLMQPPIFVPEKQKAFRLMVDLQQARKGMSVVVNEYGGAVGIATIEDVLEEIVGEIEDEFDKPEEIIREIDRLTYLLSGRVPISQINEDLEMELSEDEDFDTIAGLILASLRRLPAVGDTISLEKYGVDLEVLKMSDRAILEVKLRKWPNEPPKETT
ncbi:hemolysin family protein [Myxococcota bacterium]|nr:hemolysin family protein [Myxococcota bacterium]MBU1537683.1 hemolysin family protein [Myxococcota bacterium]